MEERLLHERLEMVRLAEEVARQTAESAIRQMTTGSQSIKFSLGSQELLQGSETEEVQNLAEEEQNTEEEEDAGDGCGAPASCDAFKSCLMRIPHTSECLGNINAFFKENGLSRPKLPSMPKLPTQISDVTNALELPNVPSYPRLPPIVSPPSKRLGSLSRQLSGISNPAFFIEDDPDISAVGPAESPSLGPRPSVNVEDVDSARERGGGPGSIPTILTPQDPKHTTLTVPVNPSGSRQSKADKE
ncbi:unnamed protein product [Tetraodon nigroviridis]|uniref:(spotted green pufferfish) hypothetical protein n=1 Tax=Tetraodon nigroviridis TaxID=99883 RepID=Q4SKD4_TETNG|nr:unnamed protein product [Tetraodon nigroviridis]